MAYRFPDPSKDPEAILEMKRMHRKLGRSAHQVQGITADILEKLLAATDSSPQGIRDRALLLVAYDTLCRMSELVSLQIEDVKISKKDDLEHMTILLRRSKTDQESTGRWLHLSDKAQAALKEWLGILGEKEGPLFRGVTNAQKFTKNLGASQVNRIYKKNSAECPIRRKSDSENQWPLMSSGSCSGFISFGSQLAHHHEQRAMVKD